MKQVKLPNGLNVFHLEVTDTDLLYREIFADDLYGRLSVAEGDVIFDVGANIGFFMLFMNQLLKQGTVYCFEPIPQIFSVLEANAKMHNHLDLQLYNKALAEKSGKDIFTFFPRTATSSSRFPEISQNKEGRRASRKYIAEDIRVRCGRWSFFLPKFIRLILAEPIRLFYQRKMFVNCELTTVSEIIRHHCITKIDLLKVDAEGSEPNILRGIEEEHWPLVKQLIVEIHRGQTELKEVSELLSSRGFQLEVFQDMPNCFENFYIVYAWRNSFKAGM